MKFYRLSLTLLLICLALLTSTQTPTAYMAENHTLMSTGFGQYLAIDGDTAIVGAPWIDSAYVYYRNQSGADTWGAVTGLHDFGTPQSSFYTASVSGDIAVVGAPGSNQAYVFYRNQGGLSNWGRVKTLQGVGEFGCDVSISGDTLIVGARSDLQGAAYIFQRNQGGTDNWGQVKRITASDGAYGDAFGATLSISGDFVVVSTAADIAGQVDQGAAYVFYRNQGGINQWGQVKKIVASDGAAGDFFGDGLAIDGDWLVAGAPGVDVNGKNNQGAAYIFYRNQGGTSNWGQVRKITAADGVAQNRFGAWDTVSISGDTIAIGTETATIDGKAGQGAAYVFYRNQGGANNWGQVRKLTALDGTTGDMFGNLEVSGNTIVIGTWNAEAAYVFYRDQGGANNWGQVKKLLMPDLTPPTNPTNLSSPSHANDVWSNDNTVDVTWLNATDDGSGVAGYSVLWDKVPSTVPDTVKDIDNIIGINWLTSSPLTDGIWYFHVRTVDQAGNWTAGAVHLGPIKIDTTAPQSTAVAPEFATSPFEVRWTGSDAGSGIAGYNIWMHDGLGGTWTQWQFGTSALNALFTNIITDHTYYFRSLAYDAVGNLATDLPPAGDTHTTIAAYQATGQVTNNRKQPVFNATVSVDPTALNTAKTSADGSHALFFGSSGAYTFTASRAGYGTLPPRYEVNVDSNLSGVDFVLPPLNDAVLNGGWESGDPSGWSVGAGLTTTVEMTAAHTGRYGVRLESSGSGGLDFVPSITQSVVISSSWARPTLSWMYQVTQANLGDALLAVVSNDSTSITATVPITIGEWQHDWFNLSAFSGQTVTLQFGFETQVAGQQILLDEVSVGDSLTGVFPIYLPLIRRS
jgi:hypothetical protein